MSQYYPTRSVSAAGAIEHEYDAQSLALASPSLHRCLAALRGIQRAKSSMSEPWEEIQADIVQQVPLLLRFHGWYGAHWSSLLRMRPCR